MAKKVRDILKYRWVALICLFAAIVINIINIILQTSILTLIVVVLLIGFILISFIFWRCPSCKKRLPIRFDINSEIDYIYVCPYCNTKFLDGNIID